MIRWIVICLMASSVSLTAAAQERNDADALRSTFEGQFGELDSNGDGELDEDELKMLSTADIQAFRLNGLPETFPITRAAFVAAGLVLAKAAPSRPVEPAAGNSESDVVKPAVTKPGDSSRSDSKDSDASQTATAAVVAAGVHTRNSVKKSHFVPELPAEFTARDKNGDGQIALYEWDRKKFSEFAKLDKNGDGFLTPIELLPKGSLKTLYSKPAARGPGSADSASGTVGDPIEAEARKTFAEMDENKDGSIDESDWGRSRRIRPWFENAGIRVSLPINAETFVASFKRAKESQSR